MISNIIINDYILHNVNIKKQKVVEIRQTCICFKRHAPFTRLRRREFGVVYIGHFHDFLTRWKIKWNFWTISRREHTLVTNLIKHVIFIILSFHHWSGVDALLILFGILSLFSFINKEKYWPSSPKFRHWIWSFSLISVYQWWDWVDKHRSIKSIIFNVLV